MDKRRRVSLLSIIGESQYIICWGGINYKYLLQTYLRLQTLSNQFIVNRNRFNYRRKVVPADILVVTQTREVASFLREDMTDYARKSEKNDAEEKEKRR